MDRLRIRETFDALFDEVEGYKLSHQSRNALGIEDKSLIYGEVIPDGFLDVLALVKPQAGETFYDLGSGTGRAVFLAAMAQPFGRLVGIEYLDGLHQAALAVKARFDEKVMPLLQEEGRAPRLELLAGDFLETDLGDADVVFMQSNCFQPPLLAALVQRFVSLRSGTRVLALGQFLNAPHLSLEDAGPCTLGWGESHYALYRRR